MKRKMSRKQLYLTLVLFGIVGLNYSLNFFSEPNSVDLAQGTSQSETAESTTFSDPTIDLSDEFMPTSTSKKSGCDSLTLKSKYLSDGKTCSEVIRKKIVLNEKAGKTKEKLEMELNFYHVKFDCKAKNRWSTSTCYSTVIEMRQPGEKPGDDDRFTELAVLEPEDSIAKAEGARSKWLDANRNLFKKVAKEQKKELVAAIKECEQLGQLSTDGKVIEEGEFVEDDSSKVYDYYLKVLRDNRNSKDSKLDVAASQKCFLQATDKELSKRKGTSLTGFRNDLKKFSREFAKNDPGFSEELRTRAEEATQEVARHRLERDVTPKVKEYADSLQEIDDEILENQEIMQNPENPWAAQVAFFRNNQLLARRNMVAMSAQGYMNRLPHMAGRYRWMGTKRDFLTFANDNISELDELKNVINHQSWNNFGYGLGGSAGSFSGYDSWNIGLNRSVNNFSPSYQSDRSRELLFSDFDRLGSGRSPFDFDYNRTPINSVLGRDDDRYRYELDSYYYDRPYRPMGSPEVYYGRYNRGGGGGLYAGGLSGTRTPYSSYDPLITNYNRGGLGNPYRGDIYYGRGRAAVGLVPGSGSYTPRGGASYYYGGGAGLNNNRVLPRY